MLTETPFDPHNGCKKNPESVDFQFSICNPSAEETAIGNLWGSVIASLVYEASSMSMKDPISKNKVEGWRDESVG